MLSEQQEHVQMASPVDSSKSLAGFVWPHLTVVFSRCILLSVLKNPVQRVNCWGLNFMPCWSFEPTQELVARSAEQNSDWLGLETIYMSLIAITISREK